MVLMDGGGGLVQRRVMRTAQRSFARWACQTHPPPALHQKWSISRQLDGENVNSYCE